MQKRSTNVLSRISETYRKTYIQVKKDRYFVLIVFGLLFLTISLGLAYPDLMPLSQSEFLKYVTELTKDKTMLELIFLIIYNNVKISFYTMLSGILLGIIPAIVLFFNGYVIGSSLNKAIYEKGILVTTKLLPHGIFEIPAFCLSLTYGFKLGFFWFINGSKLNNLKERLYTALTVFLFIVVPLLILAGIIEGSLFKLMH